MSALLHRLLSESTGSLRQRAKDLELPHALLWRELLIVDILNHEEGEEPIPFGTGVLEVHNEGFGFLRSARDNFLPGNDDIYVSQAQIRRFNLRTGDTVIGRVRAPKDNERYPALLRIEAVSGDQPDRERVTFNRLPAAAPTTHVDLSDISEPLGGANLLAPLGFGSRGLLVAPAREHRTDLLMDLARNFYEKHDTEAIVLLVGGRPDEAERWQGLGCACVVAIPFDEPTSRQLNVAELVLARAQREAESGFDTVVLIDSATRLLRAAMAEPGANGRMWSGADLGALQKVRQLLGAARATADAGTVTVVATANHRQDGSMGDALLADLDEVIDWRIEYETQNAGVMPKVVPSGCWSRHVGRLLSPEGSLRTQQLRQRLTEDPPASSQTLQEAIEEIRSH